MFIYHTFDWTNGPDNVNSLHYYKIDEIKCNERVLTYFTCLIADRVWKGAWNAHTDVIFIFTIGV